MRLKYIFIDFILISENLDGSSSHFLPHLPNKNKGNLQIGVLNLPIKILGNNILNFFIRNKFFQPKILR